MVVEEEDTCTSILEEDHLDVIVSESTLPSSETAIF